MHVVVVVVFVYVLQKRENRVSSTKFKEKFVRRNHHQISDFLKIKINFIICEFILIFLSICHSNLLSFGCIIEKNVSSTESLFTQTFLYYNEFHGFRSQIESRLFLSQLWPLLKRAQFFKAAEAVAKIGSSLKTNHHKQI